PQPRIRECVPREFDVYVLSEGDTLIRTITSEFSHLVLPRFNITDSCYTFATGHRADAGNEPHRVGIVGRVQLDSVVCAPVKQVVRVGYSRVALREPFHEVALGTLVEVIECAELAVFAPLHD